MQGAMHNMQRLSYVSRNTQQFSHGGNIHAFARVLRVKPEEVLDFSASINPLGMSQHARQAYRRALQQVVHYPEPYAETLMQALSEYHDIEPASVLVGNGSTQLIYLLARVFSLRRVLLVSPLFSEHIAALRTNGARVSYWNLRPPSFALDLERLKRTLRKEQHEALVLTNPNSPTGTLLRREQVDELIQLCRWTRVRLIVDETFIDWVEEESVKRLAARDANVIVLRSLTKFFAVPGLRVGYAVASPGVIRRLRLCIEPWSVNIVAQEVGKVCLQDWRFIERSRAFMDKERAWLHAELGAIPGLQVFPSAANFFLVQIRSPQMTAARLAELLAQKRLLIRVCDNFVGLGKQFFRVAVRTRAENRRLLEALRTTVV
jgi:threonine-phosphate decarboxylase